MRACALAFLFVLTNGSVRADDASKPLNPEQAAKKVNEKVTVEMEVKSTGGRTSRYLNSETDFKSDKNFTVFISKDALAKFKEAKIDDPATYYKGKTVRVTGKVVLYQGKPQIVMEGPEQIQLVEKKP